MNGGGVATTTVVRITLTVVAVLALVYCAYLVRSVLVLVVVALFLAIGLDPVVRALTRLRLGRGAAVAVVFLIGVLFVAGFVASVTPPLVRQTQRLAEQIPEIAREASERSGRFGELDERFDITNRLESGVRNLPNVIGGSIDSVLGFAAGVGRAIFSVVTVGILTVYFLLDFPKLVAGASKLLPASRRERFEELEQVAFDRISGYMIGQLTVSLIAGVASVAVLTALRIPYSLPLGMWVAISALIPMVGSSLGAVPAVIVAFFASVGQGIGVLAFFLAYQQVENYVVAPRVMRRAVDISAAAVILAALIGATLLGFVGALLAIPVAASLKVIVQETWLARQERA